MKLQGFEIIKKIQQGGMGAVYLAKDLKHDRLVAIKVLLNTSKQIETNRMRFEIEANAMAKINDARVIRLFDYGKLGDDQYLVMEYFPGYSLAEFVKSRLYSNFEILKIVHDVLLGLTTIHKAGIIHRDIKPGNILVDDSLNVKIIDFGITKDTRSEDNGSVAELTAQGKFVGTMQYTAPEIVTGGEAKYSADIYGLGLTALKMAIGANPYYDQESGVLVEKLLQGDFSFSFKQKRFIPEAIQNLILQMITAQPMLRFQSAKECLAELEPIQRRLERTIFYFPYYQYVHASNVEKLRSQLQEKKKNALTCRSIMGMAAMIEVYGSNLDLEDDLPIPNEVAIVDVGSKALSEAKEMALARSKQLFDEQGLQESVLDEAAEDSYAEEVSVLLDGVTDSQPVQSKSGSLFRTIELDKKEDSQESNVALQEQRIRDRNKQKIELLDVEDTQEEWLQQKQKKRPVTLSSAIGRAERSMSSEELVSASEKVPIRQSYTKPTASLAEGARVKKSTNPDKRDMAQRLANQQKILEEQKKMAESSFGRKIIGNFYLQFSVLLLILLFLYLHFTDRLNNLFG